MNQTQFEWGQMSGAVEKHCFLGLSLDSEFQSVMLSSMLILHTAHLFSFKEGISFPVQMHCLQSVSRHRSPSESIYSRVAVAYYTSFRSRSVLKYTLNMMSGQLFLSGHQWKPQSAAHICSAHDEIL